MFAAQRRSIVIEPPRRWPSLRAFELWQHRELLWILALRDVRARYKQTLLGVLWIVVQPLVMVGIFSVLFGLLLGPDRLPTVEGVPYALSTVCALLAWNLFSATVSQASGSLIDNRGLITRIYFPRLLVPAAPAIGALIDFAVSCTVYLGLLLYFVATGAYTPVWSASLLALPVFVALAVTFAFAVSLWLSSLAAIYRDVRHALPFALQLLFFVTPVVFASDVVLPRMPGWAAAIFSLNPMMGVIEGIRWSLFDGATLSTSVVVSAVAVTAISLASGLLAFRRLEQVVADVV